MNRPQSLAVSLAAGLFLCALGAMAARDSPATHPSTATTETLSAIEANDGWCVTTNGTTAVDVDAAAPARMTNALKNRVRFVSMRFVAGATSTRVCHKIGGALPAASCDALDADAVGVLTDGGVATYAAARDLAGAGGSLPQMEIQANAGGDGAVCVVVGW